LYICNKYGIKNYTINADESIDVNGDVYFKYDKINKFPLNFNKVTGYFDCSDNSLISLEGAPKYVGEVFICDYNRLKNLEGAPKYVGQDFYCDYNQISFIYVSYIKSFDNIELFNEFKIIEGNKLYMKRLIHYTELNNYPTPDFKELNGYIIL